ncbi:hypothetical protein ACGFIK_17160 [Micromonospora sp. NPDC048871]|uniref:hypothetical protein n=1 Tax=unclassified Micromonospora TaxID=2617518 RepID=UPI002E154AA3|nr:hypothetical protein OIE53_13725 [Micromonospora sp. NBC_01739]
MATGDGTAGGSRPPRRNLVAIISIVVLSGAFFGYNQGVVSGTLQDIRRAFDADTLAVEAATSWVTIGALIGALVGGHLADLQNMWLAGNRARGHRKP